MIFLQSRLIAALFPQIRNIRILQYLILHFTKICNKNFHSDGIELIFRMCWGIRCIACIY